MLRYILCLCLVQLASFPLVAQNFAMDGTDIMACTGTFTDSGGLLDDYQPGEDLTTTICSDDPTNTHVSLLFNTLNLGNGDTLTIYDAASADETAFHFELTIFSATFQFPASVENTSGCITVVFTSNGDASTGAGWVADLSCGTACQRIDVVLDNSTPPVVPVDTGFIDLCPGEPLTLRAIGVYPQNNISYSQSDATSEFYWNMGNGDTLISGQEITYTYDEPGGYYVNVTVVDERGCQNGNNLLQRVRVAAPPEVTLQDIPETLCIGDTLVLTTGVNGDDPSANVQLDAVDQYFPIGGVVSGTLPLPDGTGAVYSTSVGIAEFAAGATVTSVTDLESICLNIEHSYMHDVDIELICPNGQSTTLQSSSFITNHVYLGLPNDNDDFNPVPGSGFNYCWDPMATATWNDFSANNNGTPINPVTLPAGTYAPPTSFNSLIGCPLNGEWTLQVTDFLPQDNGFIFSWIINFDPDLLTTNDPFTVPLTDGLWQDHPQADDPGATTLPLTPSVAGQHVFAYRANNEFGCDYEAVVPIEILPGTHPDCGVCCPPPIDLADRVLCDGDSTVLVAGTETAISLPFPYGNYYATEPLLIASGSLVNDSLSLNSYNPDPLTDPATQIAGVCVSLQNTAGSPFSLTLVSPDGTTVALVTDFSAPAGSLTNVCFSPQGTTPLASASLPYVDTYLPEGNFDDLTGSTVNGTWQLELNNTNGFFDLQLDQWTFDLVYENELTYAWSPAAGLDCTDCPQVTAQPTVATTYTVQVTDIYGNATSDTVTVTPLGQLTAPLVACTTSRDTAYYTWNATGGFTEYEYRITINGTVGDWLGPISATAFNVAGLADDDFVALEVRVALSEHIDCVVPVGISSCTVEYCGVIGSLVAVDFISCFGASDGVIFYEGMQGVSPYTYQLSGIGNPVPDGTFPNLPPGTYTVVVQDSEGCQDSTVVILAEPALLTATATLLEDAICAGSFTGSAQGNAAGGTGDYTFAWTGPIGANTATLINAPAGTYLLTVGDQNGCTAQDSVSIAEPDSLAISVSVSAITCVGAANGAIDTEITGGTPPYTFLWNDGPDTPGRTALAPGTYCLTVRDAADCATTTCITLNEPPALIIDTIGSDSVSCVGEATGRVYVLASGGSGPYTYLWDDAATSTTDTVENLPQGTYQVMVTDSLGCTASASVTVDEPAPITIDFVVQDITCRNGQDGYVIAVAQGGTPAYTYIWPGGIFADSLGQLSAGDYAVTVIDAQGCTQSALATLTEPAMAIGLSLQQTMTGCFGANDSEATASAENGTPPYTYNWSNSQVGAVATGLAPQTYLATVTDANGCTDTASVSIVENTELQLEGTVSAISCVDANDGAITLLVDGGEPGYTYLWEDGSTAPDRSGLAVGTYCVTVTDALDCTAEACFTLTNPPALTIVAIGSDSVRCAGESNGRVYVSVTGGTGLLTYLWDDIQTSTTDTVAGLPLGTYTVIVSDGLGCQATASVEVFEPASLNLAFILQQVTCLGGDDGYAIAAPTGGRPPYQFDWGNGVLQDSLGQLTAGDYTVTVTDQSGCTLTETVTITEPLTEIEVMASQTFVGCFGEATSQATAMADQGAAPYTFMWSNMQEGPLATGLVPGTYGVTVTDANGCTNSTTVQIDQRDSIVLAAQVSDVRCAGADDGSISLQPGGGTPPFSFLWDDGSPGSVRDSLAPGQYCVTVSDAAGCELDTCYTIDEPLALVILDTGAEPVTCPDGTDGTAFVMATGGSGTLTYSWNDVLQQTTATVDQLMAGVYTVTVADSLGCTQTADVVVAEPDAFLIVFQSQNVLCRGDSTGTVQATATGGTSPYTYDWGNGNASDTLTDLPQGTYTVTVTDAAGCTAISSVTLIEPAEAVAVTAEQTLLGCFEQAGSEAVVTPANTFGSVQYTWSDQQMTATATGLVPGTYTVTIVDALGCTATDSVTITELTELVTDISTTPINCAGANEGSITVTPMGSAGDYTYLWGDGSTQAVRTDLPQGIYCVTVTDMAGCTRDTCLTLTEPPALTIDSLYEIPVSCLGADDGRAVVVASGGTGNLTYRWDDPLEQLNDTATFLLPGLYTIVVSDALGCTASATIEVTEPPALGLDFAVDDVRCLGGDDGSLTAMGTGGTPPYSYAWQDGTTGATFVELAAGTYAVTVTDSRGCTFSDEATVDEPSVAIEVLAEQSFAGCFEMEDNEATAMASNGTPTYQYMWQDGQTGATAVDLAPGTYRVTVTDALGCQDSTEVTVNDLAPIDFFVLQNQPSCAGIPDGALAVTQLTGGVGTQESDYTFLWSTGSMDIAITGLSGGSTHTVTVTDAQGCFTVRERTLPTTDTIFFATTQTLPSCFGAADGTIEVMDVTGPNAGFDYQWDSQAGGVQTPLAEGLTAGNYQVTITDFTGCENVATITLGQPTPVTVSIGVVDNDCFGEQNGSLTAIPAGGTPGYTYLWSNGATTAEATNLGVGSYTVTVTDSQGCTLAETATVQQPTQQVVDFVIEDVTCFEGENGTILALPMGGTGPYTYSLNNIDYSSVPSFLGLAAGVYTVYIRDSEGCVNVAQVPVVEPPLFTLDAGADTTIFAGDSLVLAATPMQGAGDVEIVWYEPYFGTLSCTECPTPTAQPDYTIDYTVYGIDENGCEASDIIRIFVAPLRGVDVPTGFTPNGDNTNDRLLVHGMPGTLVKEFRIFDRWGELLFADSNFQVNDPTRGWDGTFRSQPMNAGLYIWQVIVVYPDGVEESQHGETSLVR